MKREEIQVQTEYLIYDFNGLLGFIGGTLGLFIGFSFYGLLTDLINSVLFITQKISNYLLSSKI